MYECGSYLIVDGNRTQAVQKEQQGGVHVMKQVPGLIVLRPQREADLSGPADNRTNAVRYFFFHLLKPSMGHKLQAKCKYWQ